MPNQTPLAFHEVARLAAPGDNVAIATCRLEAGTRIRYQKTILTLNATLLEGHRFATTFIQQGAPLLSWQLEFGRALTDIAAGDYVVNAGMLEALKNRSIRLSLPETPNFEDISEAFVFDERRFTPAPPLPRHTHTPTFKGYARHKRGTGTRNYILLLGTSSRTGSFVKQLESRFAWVRDVFEHIDGVVAVAHTEGGTTEPPNNLTLVLRTLAGFMVHANIAAVLCVDVGTEAVTNKQLEWFAREHHYPLDDVPHAFMSLGDAFERELERAEALVTGWLDAANAVRRQDMPVSELKLALQCGGSDAFSGVSGNPLAGWVAKELVCYGGAANLAETDELIGAEAYVLKRVKSTEVARTFLGMIERFKTRAAWHGTSAEGNPSGGNKLRGLYNIALKSIGAANKKHPDVRLEGALEYGERMPAQGFYFMDSPGNDLESIAGQVAAGCNAIFFVTGNGSITNFPFVPTIKIVTTSERYALLKNDMDVNAGRYLQGTSMDALGLETQELLFSVASGTRTVGENAGHAQVQLWRNWQQTSETNVHKLLTQAEPDGQALPVTPASNLPLPSNAQINTSFKLMSYRGAVTSAHIGLILPTSLCAGQIASMLARQFNAQNLGQDKGVTGFVALAHTEGCGTSGGQGARLQTRTLTNYLRHPRVKHALLLEHGCEITHNDHMQRVMQQHGLQAQTYGWASIQLDGGIQTVSKRVQTWFETQLELSERALPVVVGWEALRLGVMVDEGLPDYVHEALAALCALIVRAGGTVVTPERSLEHDAFTARLGLGTRVSASLAYGAFASNAGFHVMEGPGHFVEMLTGLGASGVELVLNVTNTRPAQGHPFIPLLQVTGSHALASRFHSEFDALLAPDAHAALSTIIDLLADTLNQRYSPKSVALNNVDFQLTRGRLGISL